MKKRVFVINAVILTASSLLMRMTNIGYRVFITEKIGAAGMGLYQLILSVFILAVTVCTSGISLAVTRLVAEATGRNDPGYAKNAVKKCVACALTLSLLAGTALFFFAPLIAGRLLENPQAALPLRILAPGLPFMAVSACLRGYFIAMRSALRPAAADLLEQFSTIGIVAALFFRFAPQTLEGACCAIMLGSTAGEIASFLFYFLLYRHDTRAFRSRHPHGKGVLRQIVHIGLPAMTGYTARTILSAIENILIPVGLKKNGANEQNALAQYGIIQGMVMPVLFFPSAFLTALCSLLIPEMAEANAAGKSRAIERTACRAMQMTLLFSFFVTGVFFAFSPDIGLAFYRNEQTGTVLRILAPLVPLMYLDNVVDSILKGLDQQLSSLKYNFSDSVLRVLLIYTLIPVYGLKGYIGVLFFSTIFNASLSIHRLIKVAKLQVAPVNWVVKPALCAALSVLLAALLFHAPLFAGFSAMQRAAVQVLISSVFYYALLRACGSLGAEDVRWLKSLVGRDAPARNGTIDKRRRTV